MTVSFFKYNRSGSHIPSSWMVHAECAFVADTHPRTWMSGSFESVRWNAFVHILLIHMTTAYPVIRKSLGGMESQHMFTPREKSPLPEKISPEDRTHDAAPSRTASPTLCQRAIPAPIKQDSQPNTLPTELFRLLSEDSEPNELFRRLIPGSSAL